MTSMFSQFETSPKLETEGINVDYGDFKVVVAHAGGTNKKFISLMEAETKPFRRLIQSGAIEQRKLEEIFYKVYTKTIILNWFIKTGETEEGGVIWEQGINKKGGGKLEFNYENVMLTFKLLPNLFLDIKRIAEDIAMYKAEGLEDDAKNS